ncbi:hypothetical protein [Streptosporangium canum]|uniref:SbtR family transcriptional regulator n=1 Tax=Streptosporangium canum TaxID=324952 RepID=UPI003183E1BD
MGLPPLIAAVADESERSRGEGLVARARAAGEVRPDVTAPDLYALVNAAAWAGEQSSVLQAERLLGFGLTGFRASTAGADDHMPGRR